MEVVCTLSPTYRTLSYVLLGNGLHNEQCAKHAHTGVGKTAYVVAIACMANSKRILSLVLVLVFFF